MSEFEIEMVSQFNLAFNSAKVQEAIADLKARLSALDANHLAEIMADLDAIRRDTA